MVDPSAFYSDKECRVYILNEHQISMHDRDNDEHEAANGSVFYLLNDSEVESNSSKLVRVTLKAYLNEILSIRHVNNKRLTQSPFQAQQPSNTYRLPEGGMKRCLFTKEVANRENFVHLFVK